MKRRMRRLACLALSGLLCLNSFSISAFAEEAVPYPANVQEQVDTAAAGTSAGNTEQGTEAEKNNADYGTATGLTDTNTDNIDR